MKTGRRDERIAPLPALLAALASAALVTLLWWLCQADEQRLWLLLALALALAPLALAWRLLRR